MTVAELIEKLTEMPQDFNVAVTTLKECSDSNEYIENDHFISDINTFDFIHDSWIKGVELLCTNIDIKSYLLSAK